MSRKWIIILSSILTLGSIAFFIFKFLPDKNSVATIAQETEENVKYFPEDDHYPTQFDVPTDKEWIFSFDEPFDPISINPVNVYVLDEDSNRVNTEISITNQNRSISIKAPKEGYKKGLYYEIHMKEQISYVAGGNVSKTFVMGFFITRDKVKEYVLNKDIIEVSNKESILSNEKNIITIEKTQFSETINKDDILKIPTDDPYITEQALKVVSIKEEGANYIIEYTQPKFTELFEKLNLYEKTSLLSDNVQFIPAEHVEMNMVSSIQPYTQIASSNSASKDGEFQFKDMLEGDFELELTGEHLELALKNLPLEIKGHKINYNGKVKLYKPEVLHDIDLGLSGVNRFNLKSSLKFAHENAVGFTADADKLKRLLAKKGIKISEREEWVIEESVPLGKLIVPVVPGVIAVTFDLKAVLGINAEGSIEVTLNDSILAEAGVYYTKGEEFKPIFNIKPTLNVGITGKAVAEAKGALGLETGLNALGVTAQLDKQLGVYSYTEFYLSINTNNTGFCEKGDFGFIGELYFDIGHIFNDDWYKLSLGQTKVEIDENNTCEASKGIEVFPESITLNAGETLELNVKEILEDEITGEVSKESFLNETTKSDFDISTSNSEVVETFLRAGEESNKPGGIQLEKSGKSPKLKFKKVEPQEYTAILKVPDEVYEDKASITLTYKEHKNYPKGDNIMRNLGERSSIYQVLWGLTGDTSEMTIIYS